MTDFDLDVANGTINVDVDDDSPTVNVTLSTQGEPVLTTQDAETDGVPTNEDTASSTANFSGMFGLTASVGADGGAAPTLGFALAVTDSVSGLNSHGAAINLYLIGGVVVGSTAANAGAVTAGNTIFNIAVSGTGVVTLTQFQQIDHVNADPTPTGAPFDEHFISLANGKVTLTASSTATDNDNDTASDQEVIDLGGNIRFADDGPIAVNDFVNQPTENQPVTFGVFGNDQFGADGVDTDNNPTVNVTFTQPPPGQGTVSYNAVTGQFTFTPAPGQQGSTQFTYTIIDFDGDTSTATVTINLQPDSTPNAVDGAAAVDDDGLAGGNAASVTGDLNANASPPEVATVNPSEAIFHGQLAATAGADTIVDYDFASMHGTNGTVGTETVLYSWNNGTSTLTATTVGGTRPGTVLFDVVVNQATGEYNLTLRDNVLHAAGNNENDATTNLTFTVTDSDGDTDTGIVAVTFDDDAPTLGTIQNQEASNNPAHAVSIGTLHLAIGADSPAVVTAIAANNTGVTSGGFNLVTNVSGNVLTAYQDVNGNGAYNAGIDTVAVYTLTVNPGAGTSGQYVFDLITPLDPTVTETAIGGSSSFGAGPTSQGQVLENVAGTQDLAVISGYHMGGTFNEANWLATGNAGPASNFVTAGVNGSTAGWGIDNNNFNGTDEMFVWDFGAQALRNPDGAGGYEPPVGVTLPDISTATFDLIGYSSGAGDDITYVVHYTDGTFDSGHIPAVDINDGTWKFTADAGKFIADIEMFTSPTGSGKVDLVSVGVNNANLTETIGFNVTITDADGDAVSGAFTVEVADGNTPIPPAAMEAFSTKGGSSPLVADSQDQQTERAAANSNTLTLAAAVAAAGLAEAAAAAAPVNGRGSNHEFAQAGSDSGHHFSLARPMDGNEEAGSGLAADSQPVANVSAPDQSSSHSSAPAQSDHALDDSSANAAAQSSSVPAANDQGPASSSVEASPAALAVGMPSAAALKAAGLTGNAQTAVRSIRSSPRRLAKATQPPRWMRSSTRLPGQTAAQGQLPIWQAPTPPPFRLGTWR